MMSIRRPPEPRTAVGRSRPQRLIVGELDLRYLAIVLTGALTNLGPGRPARAHDRRAAHHLLLLDDELAPGDQRHHPRELWPQQSSSAAYGGTSRLTTGLELMTVRLVERQFDRQTGL
jgi:hypothetical protein